MNDHSSLTQSQRMRYARQIILPEIGLEGQIKLRQSSVLVVGAGGLGSPVSLYLAAAGVGTIGIVDFDTVDLSNLHRQILHGTNDCGRAKIASAVDSIGRINSDVVVRGYSTAFRADNAMDIAVDYDVVIDGTDNFATRYLVNDVCVLLSKPNCYGSIYRFEGQASVLACSDAPCYRCLYPRPPAAGSVPNCAEAGVLGVLPGIIGLIQATEAIKLLLGQGDPLFRRLLLFNALEMRFREMRIRRDPNCPVCGTHPTIVSIDSNCPDYRVQACGQPTNDCSEISAEQFAVMQRSSSAFTLIDVRQPGEYAISNLGGILIPLDELDTRAHQLDRNVPIVVHCQSGRRSAVAIEILRSRGFTDVKHLSGGMDAWTRYAATYPQSPSDTVP